MQLWHAGRTPSRPRPAPIDVVRLVVVSGSDMGGAWRRAAAVRAEMAWYLGTLAVRTRIATTPVGIRRAHLRRRAGVAPLVPPRP